MHILVSRSFDWCMGGGVSNCVVSQQLVGHRVIKGYSGGGRRKRN